MTAALSLLGASLVWVVLLTGLDRYLASNDVVLFSSYPAEIPVWGLGAGSWVMFVLHQIGKNGTFSSGVHADVDSDRSGRRNHHCHGVVALQRHHLDHVQCLDVGTAIAVAVLVSSSLVASAWRATRAALTPNDESEIIG